MTTRKIRCISMAAAVAVLATGFASSAAFAGDVTVFPSGVTVLGDFMYAQGTIQRPDYLEGQYRNGTYTYFGSGLTPLPVNGADGATLSFGGPGNSLSLHPTISPNMSLTVSADASRAADPNFPTSDIVARGDLNMTYSVVVRANSQTAADAFTALLNTSGALANIYGSFNLSETGDGWGSVGASTGAPGLDPSLQGNFFAGCP
jgi:hypothetical protein